MFGVGLPEIIVIAVIALLIFGPDKLPELTQKFGRFAGQTRKMSDSVRREFYNAVYTPAEQFRRDLEKGTRELLTVKPHLMAPSSQDHPVNPSNTESTAEATNPEQSKQTPSELNPPEKKLNEPQDSATSKESASLTDERK